MIIEVPTVLLFGSGKAGAYFKSYLRRILAYLIYSPSISSPWPTFDPAAEGHLPKSTYSMSSHSHLHFNRPGWHKLSPSQPLPFQIFHKKLSVHHISTKVATLTPTATHITNPPRSIPFAPQFFTPGVLEAATGWGGVGRALVGAGVIPICDA